MLVSIFLSAQELRGCFAPAKVDLANILSCDS